MAALLDAVVKTIELWANIAGSVWKPSELIVATAARGLISAISALAGASGSLAMRFHERPPLPSAMIVPSLAYAAAADETAMSALVAVAGLKRDTPMLA